MTTNQKIISRIETIDFKINRLNSIITKQPEMTEILMQIQDKLNTEKQLLLFILKYNKII
jgi:replication-associated recombination protein RarA